MNPVHVFIPAQDYPDRGWACLDYQEHEHAFKELGLSWEWVPIICTQLFSNMEAALAKKAVVLNLCSEDKIQGLSGLMIVRALEKMRVPFSGADPRFLNLTASRMRLKARLSSGGVPQPGWTNLTGESVISNPPISFPVIIKPDISTGSAEIQRGFLVCSQEELLFRWGRLCSPVVVEEFVDGPVISVFIIGDWTGPIRIFHPMERLCGDSGAAALTYDPNRDLRDGGISARKMTFRYGRVSSVSVGEVSKLARHAYVALGGMGYGRVDICLNKSVGRLEVIEVKANCRLAANQSDLSFLGAILAVHGLSFSSVLGLILENARQRIRPRSLSVFIPCRAPGDNECAGYSDPEFLKELDEAAAELNLDTKWQRVHLQGGSPDECLAPLPPEVVLNLCDGDDCTSPGVTIVEQLQLQKALYTGADASFYRLTTAKTVMKQRLREASVATPDWVVWEGDDKAFGEAAAAKLGYPYLLKPDVSAMSCGIERRSLVADQISAQEQLARLREENIHGVTLEAGLFAEAYVAGREYTVLIAGDSAAPETLLVFWPLEYYFNPSLAEDECFLFYERRYECDAPPESEPRYWYRVPTGPVVAQARGAALEAYKALGGCGYARVDTRMDRSGRIFILEVNANCGLGGDPLNCSMGAILHNSRTSFSEFLARIIGLAVRVHAS
jgi:D-alanine-D-alanine ligase